MKTIEELLTGCEHDGSMIPVNEVKRLMDEARKQAIADHEAFTREIIMRCQLTFPETDQELEWFNEGLNYEHTHKFMQRVMNTKPYKEGGDE